MKSKGFTLIEMIIVVAIIGILSAVAIIKYGDLLRKSNEATAYGNLGSLRSALSIYYGDMEGKYPSDLASLTVAGKYLQAIPAVRPPNFHNASSTIFLGTTANDSGGWIYNNLTSDANLGAILINCTHTDSKATVWSRY